MTQEIIGVWKLLACFGEEAAGLRFFPYGSSPKGQLIYTSEGFMSVVLMNSERTNFVSDDISEATTNETLMAFASFDSYGGRWWFGRDHGEVIHSIEYARIPNWVGQQHKRLFELRGDRLTLRTQPFGMSGQTCVVHVDWLRS
jgi:hypothetical protein